MIKISQNKNWIKNLEIKKRMMKVITTLENNSKK